MREVMKKLGRELDEMVDTLGANHRQSNRTRKRVKSARIQYERPKSQGYELPWKQWKESTR